MAIAYDRMMLVDPAQQRVERVEEIWVESRKLSILRTEPPVVYRRAERLGAHKIVGLGDVVFYPTNVRDISLPAETIDLAEKLLLAEEDVARLSAELARRGFFSEIK